MLDMIKKHLAHFEVGNWDAYKADLDPNVVYDEPATMQRATGPEEFLKAIQRWKRAFPDLKGTVVTGFVSGDQVVAEVAWEGTHTGILEGPLGTIPPTNKRGTLRSAMILTLKNGKIAEERHYFDLLTILRQLGVVPLAGVTAPGVSPTAAPPRPH